MSHRLQDAMGAVEELLAQVGAEKSAAANTEAGGYQGSTTHPVKDVDDRTDDAQTGARSSENAADVKEDQGKPGVDAAAAGTPGGQDSVQLNVGITSKATGEDPGVEDAYKGEKDDDGRDGSSTHPARTDNSALDGHKYASALLDIEQLLKQAEQAGKDFLAAVAVEAEGETRKHAEQVLSASAKPSGNGESRAADARSAYDLAGVFMGMGVPEEDQKAASVAVVDLLSEVIRTADVRAEKTAAFYRKWAEKQAAAAKKADHDEETGEEEEGDAAAAGDPAASGGEEEDAILQMLAGGGDMGAEEAAGGMAGGGMPPEAGGGMPPEAGGMPGGLTEEQLLPILLQLLQSDPSMLEGLQGKVAEHLVKQLSAPSSKEADEKRAKVENALKDILGRR